MSSVICYLFSPLAKYGCIWITFVALPIFFNGGALRKDFFPQIVSSWPGHPHPVHVYCLIRQGVHFMELVQSHELAKDKVYEFCFVVASLKIRGATGMFIRPIAIV